MLIGALLAPIVNCEVARLYGIKSTFDGMGGAYVCLSRSVTVLIAPVLFSVLCSMATKSDKAEPPEAKRSRLQPDKGRERQHVCRQAETLSMLDTHLTDKYPLHDHVCNTSELTA